MNRKAWIGEVGKEKAIYVTGSQGVRQKETKDRKSTLQKHTALSGPKPTSQKQLQQGAELQREIAGVVPDPGPCDHLPKACAERCRTARKPDDSDECKKRGYTYLETPPAEANWTDYVTKHCDGQSVWGKMGRKHGHHVVMKKGNPAFVEVVRDSQKILCKNDIDPFCGKENLFIARNWCHSEVYAKLVLAELEKVRSSGRTQVGMVLKRLAGLFDDCMFDVAERDKPMQMVDDRFDEFR